MVIYPGFKALEAIGPMSVFEYANVHLQRQGLPAGYEVEVMASSPVVASDTHMALQTTRPLNSDWTPDTAVIVGSRHIEDAVAANPEVVRWAAEAAPRVQRLVALCTGSFFLAAAGLLDDQPATTHWSVAEALQARFPKVRVQSDAIYLRAGKLWTSAGVTAGIDLALALVEADHGRGLALAVARELVVYLKRPGGQSQFSVHLSSQSTTHPGIREAQDWVLTHLDQDLALSALAERAAMSERNFRRVFAKEVGSSPAQFIDSARLEAARRLLEEGDLPLKSIAARVGYASEQPLRKLFVKHLGIDPKAYRERFGNGDKGAARPT
jgi:transcriptional regulator GlxA family with amidase domain